MVFGRGWYGWGGRGFGGGRGLGWGRGNPYPHCQFYPWLPRGWWTHGAGVHPWTSGYSQGPYGWTPPPPYGGGLDPAYPGPATGDNEMSFLKGQAEGMKREMDEIEARIKDMEASKE